MRACVLVLVALRVAASAPLGRRRGALACMYAHAHGRNELEGGYRYLQQSLEQGVEQIPAVRGGGLGVEPGAHGQDQWVCTYSTLHAGCLACCCCIARMHISLHSGCWRGDGQLRTPNGTLTRVRPVRTSANGHHGTPAECLAEHCVHAHTEHADHHPQIGLAVMRGPRVAE